MLGLQEGSVHRARDRHRPELHGKTTGERLAARDYWLFVNASSVVGIKDIFLRGGVLTGRVAPLLPVEGDSTTALSKYYRCVVLVLLLR
jgi:hypothetical protein